MKHIIAIDDRNALAKHLVNLLKSISKTNSSIGFLSESELEAAEDAALIKAMKQGLKSGIADKKTVFKKLNIS